MTSIINDIKRLKKAVKYLKKVGNTKSRPEHMLWQKFPIAIHIDISRFMPMIKYGKLPLSTNYADFRVLTRKHPLVFTVIISYDIIKI